MRNALLKTRVIKCLSSVLDQFQNEKFIRSNVAKQILNNSCEAMHEILDSLTMNNDKQQNIFDSEINVQDSSGTWVIRIRRLQGINKPENIKLGVNRKLLIEAVDTKGCGVAVGLSGSSQNCQVKKDIMLYYPIFQRG